MTARSLFITTLQLFAVVLWFVGMVALGRWAG
jgi:hypothetical protein